MNNRVIQPNDLAIIKIDNVEYPIPITSIAPTNIIAGQYTLVPTANGWQIRDYLSPHTVRFQAVDREQLLTGVKDVDRLILLNLDYRSLLAACTSDPFTNKICQDDFFWRQKVEKDMGTEVMKNKPEGMSYREQYRTLTEGMSKADAIKNGRLDYLIMTITSFPILFPMSVERNKSAFTMYDAGEAATYGRIDILEWAENHGGRLGVHVANQAALAGKINVLQWLHGRGVYPDDTGFFGAISGNHKDVIEWLLDHDIELRDPTSIANDTAADDDIDMLNFLETKRIIPDEDGFSNAVAYDRLNAVKWLIDRGIIPLNPGNIANSAVANGNFDMLELLAHQGILPDREAANYADRFRGIRMLTWLIDHGVDPDIW